MAGGNASIFSSIGNGIHDINELIFVKYRKITSWVSVFVVIGLTYVVFNAEASTDMLGRAEILAIRGSGANGNAELPSEIKDYLEFQTRSNMPGELNEGGSTSMEIENFENKVLKEVSFTLTWNDETDPPGRPRLRRYENQPDEFLVKLNAPEENGTVILTTTGNSGRIEGNHAFENEDIAGIFGQGNLTIEITLASAGNWEPVIGPGAVVLTDNGNSFELVIDLVHLQPEEEE